MFSFYKSCLFSRDAEPEPFFFGGGGKGAEADPKKAWPQLQTYFGLKTAGFLNYFENTNILVSKLM